MTEKEHVIVGTAGHIDHGKSALVKALTGIDPDTLPEEKERGLTIELGFVFMDAPGYEKQIVFIDVPGHEKFVKTMVAGANSVDLALFIVAADEGISVQTREHFDILTLLGIRHGIVALTKADLVDDARLAELTSEVRSFVRGTFLSSSPIIPVSALTGAGLEDLRRALVDAGRLVEKRTDCGFFRMPIDRVFAMQGFGAVIAGTVLSGEVRVGDRIEILPETKTARIRGIQVHKEKRESSGIGRRTALNVHDIGKDDLRRGQIAAAPGFLVPSSRIDARLRLLARAPKELKTRDRLRLHVGTDEVIARVILLEKEKAAAGDSVIVQFVLESPTTALFGDRFIVRAFSPVMTIGGGEILDTSPPRHKRFDPSVLAGIMCWEGPLRTVVEHEFRKRSPETLTVMEIARRLGKNVNDIGPTIAKLAGDGRLVSVSPGGNEFLLSADGDTLRTRMRGLADDYFRINPARALMPLADLRTRFQPALRDSLFQWLLDTLVERESLVRGESGIGIPGRQAAGSSEDAANAARIEAAFRRARFESPLEDDVRRELGMTPTAFRALMHSLTSEGRLVRIDAKVTYHRDFLEKARAAVGDHLRTKGGITIAELRDRLRVSRKYACALVEYFDRTGLTKRLGDRHVPR